MATPTSKSPKYNPVNPATAYLIWLSTFFVFVFIGVLLINDATALIVLVGALLAPFPVLAIRQLQG
jgi:hypothetical protein